MARRTKIVLGLLALASVLSLTAVTIAWFVAVSATPPGLVRSAVVRYLPEEGGQDLASLITYGNLVSGGSIDAEGVSLILPSDRLIPTVSAKASGDATTRTIRTSQARLYELGETAGSVIHKETRYYPDGVGVVTATQTQRDLLDLQDTAGWQDGNGTPLATPPDPLPGTATHSIETTTTTSTVPGAAQSVSTTVVTTLYTPLPGKLGNTYRHIRTVISTVTHEAATVDAADLWNGSTALPNRNTKTDETVLYTDLTTTRTYIVITDLAPGSVTTERTALPLTLGNLSTIDSRVRVGLSAVLLDKEHIQALEAQSLNGVWYYGRNDPSGIFIPLLAYAPATVSAAHAPNGIPYGWAKSVEDSDNTWTLWDLTFTPGGATAHCVVPPLPLPSPEPTLSPEPSASPTPTPTPSSSPEPEAVQYRVADDFYVVSSVPAGMSMTNAYFEQMFNELYCSSSPKIQIRLHYYVRQDEYMDWTQFYRDEIELTIPPAP